MKKLLLTLVLALSCVHSNAVENDEFCRGLLELAEGVMYARQNGVPLTKSFEISEELYESDEVRDVVRQIIVDAYDDQLWYSEEMKDYAIQEFGAKYYLVCNERT